MPIQTHRCIAACYVLRTTQKVFTFVAANMRMKFHNAISATPMGLSKSYHRSGLPTLTNLQSEIKPISEFGWRL